MILSEDHFNGFGAIFKCFSTAGQTAKTHVLEIQALAAQAVTVGKKNNA